MAAQNRSVEQKKQRFIRLTSKLDAMSPLKVLGRGYAIARREDGSVLTRAADACPGEGLELRLAEGSVHCHVDKE